MWTWKLRVAVLFVLQIYKAEWGHLEKEQSYEQYCLQLGNEDFVPVYFLSDLS